MENPNKTTYTAIIAIVAVILIGLGIYSAFFRGGTKSTEYVPTPNEAQQGYENKLVIEDQFPGNVVYLSSLSLKKSGFAVVYTNTEGKLGKVIGSGYFPGGTNPGNIAITQNTIEGGKYFVVLFDDTNGDKIFTPGTDLVLKDVNGINVIGSFRATTKLPVSK